MRASHNEMGWVEDEAKNFLGVALGFDFCAEHEHGAGALAKSCAVPSQGMGFERMCAQTVPAQVLFEKWKARAPRPHSRRKSSSALKVRQPLMPFESFAALFIGCASYGPSSTIKDLVKQNIFIVDSSSSYYSADKHDIAASWDEREALVVVRGEENIARLQQIHQAIVDKDLVFNAPVQSGFTRRSGLSLGIASHFSQEFRDNVLLSDQANARLEAAVVASGVRDLLKSKGLGYYALSPSWHDSELEKGLLFFLNPQDQDKNNFGWFDLADFTAWTEGKGPIPKDKKLIDQINIFTESHNENPVHVFVSTAKNAGWSVGQTKICWADPEQTRLGVKVRAPAHPSFNSLSDGVYDLLNFQLTPPPLPTDEPSVSPPARPRGRAR